MTGTEAVIFFAWGFGIGTFLFFFGIGLKKIFESFFNSDEKTISSYEDED